MNYENFDDEKYYRNVMKGKKIRRTREKDMKGGIPLKSKPKEEDYRLHSRKFKTQRRSNWYSELDSSV